MVSTRGARAAKLEAGNPASPQQALAYEKPTRTTRASRNAPASTATNNNKVQAKTTKSAKTSKKAKSARGKKTQKGESESEREVEGFSSAIAIDDLDVVPAPSSISNNSPHVSINDAATQIQPESAHTSPNLTFEPSTSLSLVAHAGSPINEDQNVYETEGLAGGHNLNMPQEPTVSPSQNGGYSMVAVWLNVPKYTGVAYTRTKRANTSILVPTNTLLQFLDSLHIKHRKLTLHTVPEEEAATPTPLKRKREDKPSGNDEVRKRPKTQRPVMPHVEPQGHAYNENGDLLLPTQVEELRRAYDNYVASPEPSDDGSPWDPVAAEILGISRPAPPHQAVATTDRLLATGPSGSPEVATSPKSSPAANSGNDTILLVDPETPSRWRVGAFVSNVTRSARQLFNFNRAGNEHPPEEPFVFQGFDAAPEVPDRLRRHSIGGESTTSTSQTVQKPEAQIASETVSSLDAANSATNMETESSAIENSPAIKDRTPRSREELEVLKAQWEKEYQKKASIELTRTLASAKEDWELMHKNASGKKRSYAESIDKKSIPQPAGVSYGFNEDLMWASDSEEEDNSPADPTSPSPYRSSKRMRLSKTQTYQATVEDGSPDHPTSYTGTMFADPKPNVFNEHQSSSSQTSAKPANDGEGYGLFYDDTYYGPDEADTLPATETNAPVSSDKSASEESSGSLGGLKRSTRQSTKGSKKSVSFDVPEPPATPVPAHASIPELSKKSDDLAKQRAQIERHAPKQPSSLRQVITDNSPSSTPSAMGTENSADTNTIQIPPMTKEAEQSNVLSEVSGNEITKQLSTTEEKLQKVFAMVSDYGLPKLDAQVQIELAKLKEDDLPDIGFPSQSFNQPQFYGTDPTVLTALQQNWGPSDDAVAENLFARIMPTATQAAKTS